MVSKDKFLVVVTVLEGRNFPKRNKHNVFVEARFDGEVLSTDPVPHTESPDFTNELAWELDKKGLHQHKMQRTSIKLQIFAQETSSSMREAVGYVILDVRSAQTKQNPKWHSVLHSKYSKSKPEIKLAIYIDEDKSPAESSFKAKNAPSKENILGAKIDMKYLKPILNEIDGYYQIGPTESCNEYFVLSVTVSFAENLPQLIPTNIPLPASGYFFYYSVLGNDVKNDVFYDLLNPNFAPERASVRIRSSVEALRAFFHSQPGIEVHLCCGDQSLGSCEVPLNSLLKKGSTEIYMRPVKVEGAFTLIAPKRVRDQSINTSTQMEPQVGVSAMLRKEDVLSDVTKAQEHVQNIQNNEKQGTRSKSPTPKTSKTKSRPKSPPPRLPSPPSPQDGSYTETFEEDSRRIPDNTATNGPAGDNKDLNKKFIQNDRTEVKASTAVSSSHHHAAVSAAVPNMVMVNGVLQPEQCPSSTSPLHYCASIDLRSIRNLQVSHHANVYLRYTYPFFGSASPIITQPPVEVRKGMEVVIPQSFCTFDFATTAQQLQETFMRVPLVVEVWDKDKERSDSQLLGVSQLQLSHVLETERSPAVHPSGMTGHRQVWNGTLPVVSPTTEQQKIGEMNVIVSVENWGVISTQRVVVGGPDSQASTDTQEVQHRHDPEPAVPPPQPRETLEYQAALELEQWKEQQEAIYKAQIKHKEIQHMKTLAEEWKKRDKEREVVAKRKEQEYQQLADKLQKRIHELEKRDKQLTANEQEVLRLKKDLEREHERKMTEMREASRRMKEDQEHQVQMEKAKTKELEEYIARLKSQIAEEEAKKKEVEHEFAKYKEQQNSKPEVRLQSEINLLTLEKVELERKLDAVTKSKVHYKQQWGRALKELARLKQKEQTAAKANLRKQQQELEHMRLRYLAAEEKEVVKSEKEELETIKAELNQLKEQHTLHGGGDTEKTGYAPLYPDNDLETTEDDHISRLIEERDSLLRTGVYTTEDRIIAELDRQIRECISRKA